MIKKLKNFAIGIVIGLIVIAGIYFYIADTKSQDQADQIMIGKMPASDESTGNTRAQTRSNYTIYIQKIDITAPIVLNVDGNDKEAYMKALESGVAHLKGTALPGANGNVVIFGHSSYYSDQPGNYKKIFSALNDIEPSDTIEIQLTNISYPYKVVSKNIVEPDEISVVNQDVSKKELTLLTCWPINSTEKRLVVKAILEK